MIQRLRSANSGSTFSQAILRRFTRQKPLGRYIADFYCARVRLVIELDGDSHFTERSERYDEGRTAELALNYIRIIRFTNSEVMEQFEGVCARIEEALADSSS
jgi:very-short-patch-repair endonuclease